jgi:hypothetical protein
MVELQADNQKLYRLYRNHDTTFGSVIPQILDREMLW